MSRSLAALLLAELTARSLTPVIFYEGEFSAGTVRLWSGLGTITWNSVEWTGAGNLLSISPIAESGDVQAHGVSVSLSGIPSSLISTVYSQARQGKPGKVWLGALDSSNAVIADPYLSFSGKLDVPSDEDDGENARITISYESRLIDLERARERRYTPEDQAIDYSTDKGFDHVASLQDVQIVWGRS